MRTKANILNDINLHLVRTLNSQQLFCVKYFNEAARRLSPARASLIYLKHALERLGLKLTGFSITFRSMVNWDDQ